MERTERDLQICNLCGARRYEHAEEGGFQPHKFVEEEPEPMKAFNSEGLMDKTFSMEFEFCAVNPDVLGLLTGGALGTPPPPTFAIEVNGVHPAKRRTFWEWLTRRPKHEPQPYRYFIPHARMSNPEVSRNQTEKESK